MRVLRKSIIVLSENARSSYSCKFVFHIRYKKLFNVRIIYLLIKNSPEFQLKQKLISFFPPLFPKGEINAVHVTALNLIV